MKHGSVLAAVIIAIGMISSACIVAASVRTLGRPPAPTAWSDVLPPDEPLRTGDVIELTVYDLTGPGVATTRTVRLGTGGKVPVTMVGEVVAAGQTAVGFEKAVEAAFRDAKVNRSPMVLVTARRAG